MQLTVTSGQSGHYASWLCRDMRTLDGEDNCSIISVYKDKLKQRQALVKLVLSAFLMDR